ncbi:MAG: DUF5677 domain-containing protein [Gammaproteobacteria bacterium]
MADDLNKLYAIIDGFTERAEKELVHRLEKWPPDLGRKGVHEVIGALLARQVTLASQIAVSPNIWNGHTAPLMLRAMADVFITLAWLLKKPDERCQKFIDYGLGQQKLELEHRRVQMRSHEIRPGESEYCDTIEAWIDSQRATFLTEVNLGSWSGLSTRAMADEAGCLDFYNYVYTPFSACAHSMWHHVARYNLKTCENPLHRYHWVPAGHNAPLDPDYLRLAAKYLRKTFAAFDEALGITAEIESAYKYLCDAVDELGEEQATEAKPAATDEPSD